MNISKKIALCLTLASIIFSEKGNAMNNNIHDEERNSANKSAVLKPYHPSFSIGNIAEKYSEKDMIGYYKKNPPVKTYSFMNKGFSFFRKIFKK
jgi:hypothetical protein